MHRNVVDGVLRADMAWIVESAVDDSACDTCDLFDARDVFKCLVPDDDLLHELVEVEGCSLTAVGRNLRELASADANGAGEVAGSHVRHFTVVLLATKGENFIECTGEVLPTSAFLRGKGDPALIEESTAASSEPRTRIVRVARGTNVVDVLMPLKSGSTGTPLFISSSLCSEVLGDAVSCARVGSPAFGYRTVPATSPEDPYTFDDAAMSLFSIMTRTTGKDTTETKIYRIRGGAKDEGDE